LRVPGLCWLNLLTLVKHELASAGTPQKRRTIDATTKQHLTCENIQELHGFIVPELSLLVHFVVLLFLRFTYGNYAATLAYEFWGFQRRYDARKSATPGPPHARLRHIHIMEKQGL
jgi:hypothetical protein